MSEILKNNFVLIGSGGHASVVASLSRMIGINIRFIAVPEAKSVQNPIPNVEYLVDDELINISSKREYVLLNGIGQKIGCNLRAAVFQKFKNLGFEFQKTIHPFSFVDPSSKVSEGAQVMAGAVIQNDCLIGENSIINTNSSIDHGSQIGSSCHVAPGAVVCGDVFIGNNCFIGAGAIITEGTKLAENTTVKARQVVNCKKI